MRDTSYAAVLSRKNEIMKASLGIDFDDLRVEPGRLRLRADDGARPATRLDDIVRIQSETKVGGTPLHELTRLTEAVRAIAGPGKGARILVKDEAANASGSFKARRASISAYEAKQRGYEGRHRRHERQLRGRQSRARRRMRDLKCIILQEVFDSRGVGQPEIVEKSRACEAYGAEVQRLSVGPELFYVLLRTLEETGFFNASLYTPFGIRGVETLGVEIARQVRERYGKEPDAVVITHAGGGNLTGTARGLLAEGCTETRIVACSVDLARPAHGLRHRLQPQDLHHRPHRLRRPLRHLARPGRRAAQRRAEPALHGRVPARQPGRGLLRHRAADEARGARARPGRQHEPDRGRHARAPDGPRPDRRRPGDRVHRRRQAPQPPALVRPRERHRSARRRPGGQRAREDDRHPRSGWTRCGGGSRTWTSSACRT